MKQEKKAGNQTFRKNSYYLCQGNTISRLRDYFNSEDSKESTSLITESKAAGTSLDRYICLLPGVQLASDK